MDEDQPVAGRRPADRLAAHLRRPTPTTSSSSSRRTGARACRSTRSRCRTSRRTATRTPIRAWTCRSRQEAKLIKALGPKLRRAGLKTKLFGYDHNWSEHPNDIANTPPGRGSRDRVPDRPARAAPARWLAGTAFHCYAGDQIRQTELHDAFPRQGRLVHRVLRLARPDRPAGAGVLGHAEVARAQPHARRDAQLGQDRRQLEPRARPERRPAQRRLRHVHRRGHRRPGRHRHAERRVLHARAPRALRQRRARCGSPAPRSARPAGTAQIMDVAFRNRDGSTALVVHNENDDPRSFAVAQGGASFDYTLPGGALATFVWPARARRRAAGCSTTTARAPRRERQRGQRGRRRRHHAVDDRRRADAGPVARRSTSVARETVRRVVLDTGAGHAATSRAATRWRRAATGRAGSDVASGAGSGQLTTIDLRPTRARCLRVVQTGSAPQWWSVAEVRVYH